MKKKHPPLTDKERILFFLFPLLAHPDVGSYGFKTGPHVEYGQPKKGDLVICSTSGRFKPHPYVVGWAVSNYNLETGQCFVKEIGGERVCNISNESFQIIKGVRPEFLFEGAQHLVHQKVIKAIGDSYIHRWHTTRFENDELVITIREAFGGHSRDGMESVPYEVRMPWKPRPTIKSIVAALKEAGFGTRKFERRPKVETRSQEPTTEAQV